MTASVLDGQMNKPIKKTTDEIDRLWRFAEPVVQKIMNDLSVSFLSYSEVNELGMGMTLSNNSDIFGDFVALGYELVCPLPDNRSQSRFRYFIDENSNYSKEVDHSITHYGIKRVLNFVEISDGLLKILCVGFDSESAIIINHALVEEIYLRYIMTELSMVIQKEKKQQFQFIQSDKPTVGLHEDLEKLKGYVPRLSPIIDDYMRLTKQEQRVVNYTLRGLDSRQIAELLSVSSRTIEHHFYQLKHKINCSTKHEIVNYFMPLQGLLQQYAQYTHLS
jgi:DNA-binding CsgD family transcriptional regulator